MNCRIWSLGKCDKFQTNYKGKSNQESFHQNKEFLRDRHKLNNSVFLKGEKCEKIKLIFTEDFFYRLNQASNYNYLF